MDGAAVVDRLPRWRYSFVAFHHRAGEVSLRFDPALRSHQTVEMIKRSIANARTCAVDPLLVGRYTGDTNFFGTDGRRKMAVRSMIRWYANRRRHRFGLAGSVPAAKQPEPRHEPEIAMARLLMDATLGDPGYGKRSFRYLAKGAS